MNVSNWTKYSSAGNRIANPDLKTENIQNIELSGSYRLNRNFHAEVSLYQDYIEDVVGTVPVPNLPGKTHNDNIGKFNIIGAQATVDYEWKTVNAWFNYTFCNPRQTYSETGEVDNRVGDISSHQFNLGVNKLFFDQLNVNLRLNFSGDRPVGESTTVPLNTATFPSVAILNGAITYENSNIVKGLGIQLACNNILDTKYFHPGTKAADGTSSPTEILQRGRHFYIKASYNF
jgi:outer membrane cobalamin receptor